MMYYVKKDSSIQLQINYKNQETIKVVVAEQRLEEALWRNK